MRILPFAVLALLAGCSEPPQAPSSDPGPLWLHREHIAQAFQLRTGALAGSMREPIRACHRFWETGDPAQTAWTPAACEQAANRLATRLTTYLGFKVTAEDVGDARLWRYVATRAKL